MSRSFLGFGQVPYIGQPFTNPIKLAGISGQQCPLLFQWISYGAATGKSNINVLVDIDNAVCKALDQIRSVYIDNLGSDNPVYVYFPDTGYTVVAKPNSEGWYPAFTNAKKIWVVGEGFLTGDIPQTYIILCNIQLQAAVNNEIDNAVALWKASPIITRGSSIYNASLGIPALGDQFFSSGNLNAGVAGQSVPLWNSPYASGFITITSIQINLIGDRTAGSDGAGQMAIESTGIAGILISPYYWQSSVATNFNVNILSLSGLQIKLDATQTWRARVITAIFQGIIQVYTSYTQGPN